MLSVAYKILSSSVIVASAAGCSLGAQPQEGGVESAASQVQQAIVGGSFDPDAKHDAVVMVYNASTNGLCTGSVISRSGEKGVILTARHCVSKLNRSYVTCDDDIAGDDKPSNIYVLSGSDPDAVGGRASLGSAEKIYHPGGTSLCNTDFAVIVLNAIINKVDRPLRVRVNAAAYRPGEQFSSIGYGLTDPGNDGSSGKRFIRKDVTITGIGPKRGVYSKEFLGTSSTCSGDSGGPAVTDNWTLIGVTSRGGDCTANQNVWTRVDSFAALVDRAAKDAQATYLDETGAVRGYGFPAIQVSGPQSLGTIGAMGNDGSDGQVTESSDDTSNDNSSSDDMNMRDDASDSAGCSVANARQSTGSKGSLWMVLLAMAFGARLTTARVNDRKSASSRKQG